MSSPFLPVSEAHHFSFWEFLTPGMPLRSSIHAGWRGFAGATFEPARSVGDTWLLTALWKQLGFADAFRRVLRRHRRFDAEHLLRVMVFNRLCEPESKLGVLRWLEGTRVPDVAEQAVTHQHLLRTMDTVNDHADELESAISTLLRPLIDDTLSVVFYDLTTIRTEGQTELADERKPPVPTHP